MSLKPGEETCPRDSAPGQEVRFDSIPPILAGKLQQVELFARGDTGSLYLARVGRTAPQTVIKLLSAEVVEQVSERSRLKRELRKQTTLTNNSLCRIHDGGEEGPVLWLSRDFVEGESLAVKLRREKTIEPNEAYSIVAQVASALDELHRSGLLHRDLKPGHILLEAGGASTDAGPVVKLIDACTPARLEAGGVFPLLGTPAYMAPEQSAGKPVSFRSDLYALGCVFHEMLSGAPPFSGADAQAVLAQHMSAEPPELAIELPPAVRQLLQNLLSKDPRKRPFSAQQVRRVLEPFLPASTPREQSGGTTSAGRLSAPLGAAGPETVGFPRSDSTQEIVLDEVAVRPSRPQAFPSERPTENLEPEAIESLLVEDEEPAQASAGGDQFVDFDAESVRAPAPVPSPAPPLPAAAGAKSSVPVVPRAQPRDLDSDSQVTRVFRPDQAMMPPPAVGRGSSKPPPPPPGAASVPPPPPGAASGPPTPPRAPVMASAAVEEPVVADPEGTVMVRRRPASSGAPMLWGAAGAVVLIVMWLVFSGDDEAPPPTSEAVAANAASDEGAKAREPAPNEEPAAAEAKAEPKQPSEPAAAAPSEPAPAEPAAEPTTAEPAPSAAAEPAADARAPKPAASSDNAPGPDRGDPGASSRRDSTAPIQGSRAERVAKAEELKAEGRTHFQAGRFEESARSYEKATRLNPTDAGAFAGLGASRLQAKDAKGAIRAYERAVQLKPDVSGFQAALGKAYQEQGDRGRAIAAYKRALQLNPQNAPAKNALKALGAKP